MGHFIGCGFFWVARIEIEYYNETHTWLHEEEIINSDLWI